MCGTPFAPGGWWAKETPRLMNRTLLLSLMVVSVGCLVCCGEAAEHPEGRSDASAEAAAERERKARALFSAAVSKARQDKIPLFERLIGLFPESPLAVEARFRLINVLIHPEVGRANDALEAVRAMASRHPEDARTVEAWWWMALHWRDDEVRGSEVRGEWARFLDAARRRPSDDSDFKGRVWLHSAYAAHWNGDQEAAMAWLAEASTFDIPDRDLRAQIAFRTGSYHAESGDADRAHAAFERALGLVEEGAKGVSAPAIREQLKGLRNR